MDLSLRPFEVEDLEKLGEWSSAVGSYRYMQKVTPLNYSGPSDLKDWGSSFVWYAIVIDGDAVGGVWIDRRRPGDDIGILGIIIGRPDILGQGIGRRAIEMAIDGAVKVLAVRRIRLTVRSTNERAVRAYRSVGFEIDGEGVTSLPDGTQVPFFRMEKDLSPIRKAI